MPIRHSVEAQLASLAPTIDVRNASLTPFETGYIIRNLSSALTLVPDFLRNTLASFSAVLGTSQRFRPLADHGPVDIYGSRKGLDLTECFL